MNMDSKSSKKPSDRSQWPIKGTIGHNQLIQTRRTNSALENHVTSYANKQENIYSVPTEEKKNLIKVRSHSGFENRKAKFAQPPRDPGRVLHVIRDVSVRWNAKKLECILPKTQSKGSISSLAFLLGIEPQVMAALIRKRKRNKIICTIKEEIKVPSFPVAWLAVKKTSDYLQKKKNPETRKQV